MGSTSATLQLTDHFKAALGDWTRITNQLQAAFAVPDDALLGGATRPDVSVLSGADLLIATVECKTNLGWNRKGWKEQCEARNAALCELFPGCTSYMCVLTQKNWNSNEFLNSPFSGKQWFCLSKVNVGKIGDPADAILHSIESMFLDILTKVHKLTGRLSSLERHELPRESTRRITS
jgi:hypothetical protein